MATKKKPSPPATTQDDTVTVRALAHLYEDGVQRAKGETFQLSAARAAVLPELVETVQ